MCYDNDCYEDVYDDRDGYGNARVCPSHPWVVTSSPDGMFDCPCGVCEAEMENMGPHDQEPVVEDDPIIGRRMGHPVYLSQVEDDDVPF